MVLQDGHLARLACLGEHMHDVDFVLVVAECSELRLECDEP